MPQVRKVTLRTCAHASIDILRTVRYLRLPPYIRGSLVADTYHSRCLTRGRHSVHHIMFVAKPTRYIYQDHPTAVVNPSFLPVVVDIRSLRWLLLWRNTLSLRKRVEYRSYAR
jgi:hypothetical protein